MRQYTHTVAGLVLAGGKGTRIGGEDKGLMKFQGQTLIERQLDWMSPQVEQILISANRNLEDYSNLGYSVILDNEVGFHGPLQGVVKGLEQMDCDWLFVQPVDLPFLPQDIIAKICTHIESDVSCYYLSSDERAHYLSLLISRKLLPQLKSYLADNGKRVRGFLEQVNAKSLNLGVDESFFRNLNELSDYE